MAKFRVNILSLGSLGHFGEPMDLLQVMLVAATSVRKHPSSMLPLPPFTTFCVPDLNIGTVLYILE